VQGATRTEIEEIGRRWTLARLVTRQPALSPAPELLFLPWTVLLNVATGSSSTKQLAHEDALTRACEEVAERGQIIAGTVLPGSPQGPPLLFSTGDSRAPTREERVVAFESAAAILSLSEYRNPLAAFELAYRASLISPGSLEHVGLLLPLLPAFPEILVWYGFLAGLMAKAQPLSLGGGLGMRVLRDAVRQEDWLERPTCDIAFSELEMVLKADNPQTDFRIGSQSQLNVELAPGVNTVLRWPPKSESPGELFSARVSIDDVRKMMGELNARFHDLDRTRSKLVELLNLENTHREGSRRSQQSRKKR
jgi:hypothetical protein